MLTIPTPSLLIVRNTLDPVGVDNAFSVSSSYFF